MKILHDVYEHDFGLLLPCKSGVAWEHQTAGVLCHHPVIEGIFLPLPKPYSYPKGVNSNDLLSQLTQANYKGVNRNKAEIRRIWREINQCLFFTYKPIQAPKRQPENQEGIQWIKITKIKRVVCWKKLAREAYEANNSDYGSLVGKQVALIYPNCD